MANKLLKQVLNSVIIFLVLFLLSIVCCAVLLNLKIPIVSYEQITGDYRLSMEKAYGSSGSAVYGEATIADMLFNKNCPKIYNPKTFNFDKQQFNKPFALNIVTCDQDIKLRWLNNG